MKNPCKLQGIEGVIKTWTHLSRVKGAPDKYCLSLSICLFLRVRSLPRAWDSFPPTVYRTMGLEAPKVRFTFKVLNFNFCPESICLSRFPLGRQTPSRNQLWTTNCSKRP